MPSFVNILLAPIIGAILAFLAMFGLVQSQTAGPSHNPAEQAALVYGQ
jgi:hypothetical protein